MCTSDVCPTEDAIKAFLECLVDPLLPAKSSRHDSPSLSQQQLVAKQVHTVVILYNYYHRRQCLELEFLDLLSFCKLAIVLRPPLLAYMNFMQRLDDAKLSDPKIQLSVTERTIMDAYDVCNILDALKETASMEGWPASRVAVFLVDSQKENCFLLFGSVDQRVWSIIEKVLNDPCKSSEGTPDGKPIVKKRIIRRPVKDYCSINEEACQRHAFLAVQEAAGIKQTDLLILESHSVYSLTKEKSVCRFYIMQCNQPADQALKIPIKDTIDRLQGPLLTKTSLSWSVTPAVEYFYILPYAGILSAWFYRKASPDSFKNLKANSEIVSSGASTEAESDEKTRECSGGISKENAIVIGSPVSNEQHSLKVLSHDFDGAEFMDVDSMPTEDTCKIVPIVVQDSQGKKIHPIQRDLNGLTTSCQTCIPEHENDKNATGNICKLIPLEHNAVPSNNNALPMPHCSEDIDIAHAALAAKVNDLSPIAVRFLLKQRAKLSLQQRNTQDEMAQCDKKLQIIAEGREGALALVLQCVIDGCNDLPPQNVGQGGQCLTQQSGRGELREAIPNDKNPCQELDHICNKNNWILPMYSVSSSDGGGFLSSVTMKAKGSESSASGEPQPTPQKARESAAAHLLAKLKEG